MENKQSKSSGIIMAKLMNLNNEIIEDLYKAGYDKKDIKYTLAGSQGRIIMELEVDDKKHKIEYLTT